MSQAALAQVGVAMLVLGALVVAAASYAAVSLVDDSMRPVLALAGGFGGLTMAVVGGFLYAGSWIACLVDDHRATDRRLAHTLLALTDVTAQAAAASADVGALTVTVGEGTVLHRRDCPLVAYRPDLLPADSTEGGLSRCRVCQP